ncbi:hypothetical protein SK128_003445 [Halocaridina rubra]|uniref:Uncharacterized protein n=1 Tax=Halocaridina rubra TaxID=373956 RepID=A0AAN8WVG5_HALRR
MESTTTIHKIQSDNILSQRPPYETSIEGLSFVLCDAAPTYNFKFFSQTSPLLPSGEIASACRCRGGKVYPLSAYIWPLFVLRGHIYLSCICNSDISFRPKNLLQAMFILQIFSWRESHLRWGGTFVTLSVSSSLGPVKTCISNCSTDTNTRLGWYCFPITFSGFENKTEEVTKAIFGTGAKDFFQNVGKDIRASWREIIYMCLIGLVFTIIITAMLR